MNKSAQRLIDRTRDKLRALELSLSRRRDRAQVRLLNELSEVLRELEVEIYTAHEERERESLTTGEAK